MTTQNKITTNTEPSRLRNGKRFHKLIQDEWEREAEGDIHCERHVVKPNGRRGRVDVFVVDDDLNGSIAIVEVKATDWDKIAEKNVRRNVRRQIRQIWSYIESQILKGEYVASGEGKNVCPGIIFPKRPKDEERMKLIEGWFEEEGIPVVWHDETKEERKMR
ncbi:hypothetical protein KAR91_22370 [Candidatus Pacearchaeota archaeon]|nr:hypothetical protein [Candidatus Pacearchaeota archaeon]